MKVTKNYIKQLVKEELEKTLSEGSNTAIFRIKAEPFGFASPPQIQITDGTGKTFRSAEQFVEAYPESDGRIDMLRTKIIEMVRDSKGEMGSVQNPKAKKNAVERFVQAIAKFDLNASDYNIEYV